MKRKHLKKLILAMLAGGMLATAEEVLASAYQLWEQDAVSVGNYHAGRAAEANDASIAYYNPAGMPRIKNQQLVLGAVGIFTDLQYTGNVAVNTFMGGHPQSVRAQGGNFSFVPNMHYVAPLSDKLGFGFSIAEPFGLKTTYGRETFLRYASYYTSIQVVDYTPSLGYSVNDKFSIGAGLDIQRMSSEFDLIGVLGTGTDTDSTNKGFDTAYGFHIGGLYQFNPSTRLGLTYTSSVQHQASGSSKFVGPLANAFNMNRSILSRDNATIKLPAYTTLSVYHQFTPQWAMMGTLIYTQWSVVNNIVLHNLSGIAPGGMASRNITVMLPQRYSNSLNLALGADYYATDKLTVRAGIGYDQTPASDRYRTIQIPCNNRYAIAFGGHYQAMKTLGLDLGWTHLFMQNASINPPPQVVGAQITTTSGTVQGAADVLGAQITWDFI